MKKPVVVFEVLECNGNTAIVSTNSCTLRVYHGTDMEIVPRDAAPVWSEKGECAYIGTDGYDVEVDTIVDPNAELFIASDVLTCDEHSSDIMLKLYLTEQFVNDIAFAIEKRITEYELEKLEKEAENY